MAVPVQTHLEAAGLVERGGLWVDADELVGAVISPLGVFIGWVDVAWAGPHTPELQLREVVHLPPGRLELDVAEEVRKAAQRGQAGRRECRYCGHRKMPGHMHSKDVCQGCGERELGVIH
jgi:hypothetical protein